MKLKNAKFSVPVMVGSDNVEFASPDKYEVEVCKEPYLRIRSRVRNTDWTYTSFANVAYFTPVDETDITEKKVGAKK